MPVTSPAAASPVAVSRVDDFLLVTISGAGVTVRGVDETGRVFDSQSCTF